MYLGLHKLSSYLSSRWFEYKFFKLWDSTPVEVIVEVKCLWILAFKPFAKFTRICLICRDAFLQLFDPFSKNSPQTNHSLFLKCPYFLRCDKMPWKSTRWLEKWRFGRKGEKPTPHNFVSAIPRDQSATFSRRELREAWGGVLPRLPPV